MSREVYGSTLRTEDWERALEINDIVYEGSYRIREAALRRGDNERAEFLRKALVREQELGERISWKINAKNYKGGNA